MSTTNLSTEIDKTQRAPVNQETKVMQLERLNSTRKQSSFFSTVQRTQKLMKVLKTMNTVGEIKQEEFAPMNIIDPAMTRRREGKVIEKAASLESSETSNSNQHLESHGNSVGVTASSRRLGQRFIILHYSPFKAVWDWVVILLVLYTGIITPYTISFLSDEDQKRTNLNAQAATRQFNRERSSIHLLVTIDVLVDVVFILDLLISFRTTFVRKETNEVITNPIQIARHFVIDSWRRFAADILGALPWDILFFGNGSHSSMRLANCFKLARLLRLIAFAQNFQKTEYRAAVLCFLMLMFAIAAHWLACIFHFIAILERPNLKVKYSWLDHLADKYNMPYMANDTLSGPDLKSKYMTALFFAMTSLTSVGFGNVAPNTNGEKLFSILSMLAGSFLSASILGSVTTIIIKLYQGAEELKEMKQSIDDFIKHHRISKPLAKRMEDSFDHEWKNTKGIDMNMILKTFPECIQADICLHLNRELLNNCPVFEDANEVALRALALLFKSTHVPPGDTLIHQGDILHSIYFIRQGQMEILQNNELQAILGRNDVFGENPFDSNSSNKAHCIVRGLTYCTLNKIDREDLMDVLRLYPDFSKSFKERFRVTFDLRQCQLIQAKPFHKLDHEIQHLIRQRNPKLQREKRLSDVEEYVEEEQRLSSTSSTVVIRKVSQKSPAKAQSSIVELSPEETENVREHFTTSSNESRTISPLVHGTLNNVVSTVMALSRRSNLNVAPRNEENFREKIDRLNKFGIGPIRSLADVDAELSILENRFDRIQRTIDDRMKQLFDFANGIEKRSAEK